MNTIVGRHGIAGSYEIMRLGIMLSTFLSTDGCMFTIAVVLEADLEWNPHQRLALGLVHGSYRE
jgi:hypothetical protein